MRRALIIVDVQHDFLPGGALGVENGDEILDAIRSLAAEHDDPAAVIITTQDWHPYETPHFAQWPRHCVRGTDGADLHPDVEALDPTYRVVKGVADEDGYSGFEGATNDGQSLGDLLRFEGVDDVTVCGLALDYCVKATALDAVKEGFNVTVPLAATAAVDRATGAEAIEELRRAGVVVESAD